MKKPTRPPLTILILRGGVYADVQQQALNGAQMTALQSIAQSVANNELPAETAVQLIVMSMPSISRTEALALIAPAKDFTPDEKKNPASPDDEA